MLQLHTVRPRQYQPYLRPHVSHSLPDPVFIPRLIIRGYYPPKPQSNRPRIYKKSVYDYILNCCWRVNYLRYALCGRNRFLVVFCRLLHTVCPIMRLVVLNTPTEAFIEGFLEPNISFHVAGNSAHEYIPGLRLHPTQAYLRPRLHNFAHPTVGRRQRGRISYLGQ